MSIQSVGSNGLNIWQTMQNDFQALAQNLAAVQSAQKSGAQDQVQISEEALQKAITSFQNDVTGLQNDSNGNTSTGVTSGSNPFQTFTQDITALQNALNSGNQDQITSAVNTVQNDISGLKSHHHHHHHHHGADGNTSTGTTNGSNPFQTLTQDITALQNALNSGNQDQITSAVKTVQNDISGQQQ